VIGRLSVRTRVLIAMFAVFATTLVAVGLLVTSFTRSAAEASTAERLEERAALAQQLATRGATAQQIITALDDEATKLHLDLTNGTTLGQPLPEGNPDRYRYHRRLLDVPRSPLDQARVTVWTHASAVTDDLHPLQHRLVVLSVTALLVAGVLIVITVDVALKPLTTMADRARQVSEGERGIRMGAPTDSTEIGRAATAIDDMLDELEGAMHRAAAAEQRAEQSRAQMQQFLADAAHELKTPMAGIQAAAEALVQMSADDDGQTREELSFLLGREAHRAGQLVNSLLEAARIDSGMELLDEPVDLAAIVDAEQARLSLARPGVNVVTHAEPAIVRGDHRALTSIVRNVAANAARAAGPHGWVSLHLSTHRDRERPLAVVHVADSGRGIEPVDRERVFERLVRLPATASTEPGSGLGLAIARGYARAHGGDLRHADDGVVPGQPVAERGAAFVVELPLAD